MDLPPVVLCGPSGAGTSTLIDMLMKRFPNEQLGVGVSHTTRKPREGEVDGVHYHFTSLDNMVMDFMDGKFVKREEVRGNYYATSFAAVESVQKSGKICILDINVQDARSLKKSSSKHPWLKPRYVFVAPSMDVLEARLRGSETESKEDIVTNLDNAAKELEYGRTEGNFDKVFIDADLESTFERLVESLKDWYPQLVEAHPDTIKDIAESIVSNRGDDEGPGNKAGPWDSDPTMASRSIPSQSADEKKIDFAPVVFCGPSGVGTSTLINLLMKRFPNEQFGFGVSHTTRKPREGEVDGVHYHFTSLDSMVKDFMDGKFVEHVEIRGDYYGTSVAAVESVRKSGKVCILDVDVQGVKNAKESSLEPLYVFIAPPSMDELEARLRGRGAEAEEDIVTRLGNAAKELEYGQTEGNFDKVFINADLESTLEQLVESLKDWYPHLVEAHPDTDINGAKLNVSNGDDLEIHGDKAVERGSDPTMTSRSITSQSADETKIVVFRGQSPPIAAAEKNRGMLESPSQLSSPEPATISVNPQRLLEWQSRPLEGHQRCYPSMPWLKTLPRLRPGFYNDIIQLGLLGEEVPIHKEGTVIGKRKDILARRKPTDETDKITWVQDMRIFTVTVDVEGGLTPQDVKVDIKAASLMTAIRRQKEDIKWEVRGMVGKFPYLVDEDESTWYVVDGVLIVELIKQEEKVWNSLLVECTARDRPVFNKKRLPYPGSNFLKKVEEEAIQRGYEEKRWEPAKLDVPPPKETKPAKTNAFETPKMEWGLTFTKDLIMGYTWAQTSEETLLVISLDPDEFKTVEQQVSYKDLFKMKVERKHLEFRLACSSEDIFVGDLGGEVEVEGCTWELKRGDDTVLEMEDSVDVVINLVKRNVDEIWEVGVVGYEIAGGELEGEVKGGENYPGSNFLKKAEEEAQQRGYKEEKCDPKKLDAPRPKETKPAKTKFEMPKIEWGLTFAKDLIMGYTWAQTSKVTLMVVTLDPDEFKTVEEQLEEHVSYKDLFKMKVERKHLEFRLACTSEDIFVGDLGGEVKEKGCTWELKRGADTIDKTEDSVDVVITLVKRKFNEIWKVGVVGYDTGGDEE